jgi:hypothetical protein
VPLGTSFDEEPCSQQICGPEFIDATPDLSHIVLQSYAALSPDAVGGQPGQLYEWVGGKLTLISLLPEGGGTAVEPQIGDIVDSGGSPGDTRGAISGDGSRIVWAAGGRGHEQLYMRDVTRKETVQLNVAEPGCVAEGRCESGGGRFQLASADGSKVFFTDEHRLTKDSGAGVRSTEAYDLYECEMVEAPGSDAAELAEREAAHTAIRAGPGHVLGVAGDSALHHTRGNSPSHAWRRFSRGSRPSHCTAYATPSSNASSTAASRS